MEFSKIKIVLIIIAAIILSALSIYLMVNDTTPCPRGKNNTQTAAGRSACELSNAK